MYDNRRKIVIAFLLPTIKAGGAEKVVINMANNLPKDIFKTEMIVLSGELSTFQKLLDPSIVITNLCLSRFRDLFFKPLRFYRVMRKIKPDILFSGYGELNPLVALYRLIFPRCTFIARETSIPSLRIKSKVIYTAYLLFYRLFHRIVVQSKAMEEDVINSFHIPRGKTVLIKNLIDSVAIDNALKGSDCEGFSNAGKLFLFVGSLDANKRVDRIIDLFEHICSIHPGSILRILGGGSENNAISERIRQSLFGNQIQLLPVTNNPYIYIKCADFLLIASEYEGFPNVGIEALYCGTPVLLDKRTIGGAVELIKPGINGEIVDFDNPDLTFIERHYHKEIMKDYVIQNHGVRSVIGNYTTFFMDIVNRNKLV